MVNIFQLLFAFRAIMANNTSLCAESIFMYKCKMSLMKLRVTTRNMYVYNCIKDIE